MKRELKTIDDLKKYAAECCEDAKALGARAVIVIVSIDDPNAVGIHSLYGYAHRGPCLDLDGLSRRITQATDANWRHTITSVPESPLSGGSAASTAGRGVAGGAAIVSEGVAVTFGGAAGSAAGGARHGSSSRQ
jgi:hypothetical protein